MAHFDCKVERSNKEGREKRRDPEEVAA